MTGSELRVIQAQFTSFPEFLKKVKSGLSSGQTQEAAFCRQVAGHAYFTWILSQ
jgi:hypothetical protein